MEMTQQYRKLRAAAAAHGQGHVFRWWRRLSQAGRKRLLAQVRAIDFAELDALIAKHVRGRSQGVRLGALRPAEPIALPTTAAGRAERRRAIHVGEEAIGQGHVAALVVAGGQGTRLGHNAPKGTYPAAPITGRSLFGLHADKLLAARRRYGAPVPWYIMTSHANHRATQRFLAEHDWFGLPRDDVRCFQQGWMPAVDLGGKLLLAAEDRIATSPNGHGGTLRALRDSGMLDDLRRRGVRVVSYFQVDNVLIQPVDPAFVGYHIERGSEFSSKALPKRDPEEGLGVFCRDSRRRLRVIEYSDLAEGYKYARRRDGSLRFSAGRIAIHAMDVDFVARLTRGRRGLPYHRAVKKVPHLDARGRQVVATEPNAVKFEMFIFDAIARAKAPLVLMVERAEEFAPIKQADAHDSPATARQAQVNLFGSWLEQAGVRVARDFRGDVAGAIEISPLYALDAAELRRRLPKGTTFGGALNLQP